MTSARTVTLPGDIDAEHATARLKDGLLEVTLPETAKAKLQRIAVSALYQRMASTDGINGWYQRMATELAFDPRAPTHGAGAP